MPGPMFPTNPPTPKIAIDTTRKRVDLTAANPDTVVVLPGGRELSVSHLAKIASNL